MVFIRLKIDLADAIKGLMSYIVSIIDDIDIIAMFSIDLKTRSCIGFENIILIVVINNRYGTNGSVAIRNHTVVCDAIPVHS